MRAILFPDPLQILTCLSLIVNYVSTILTISNYPPLQVNMPADSFESPLTLAACGGHVKLAMLLLERGANIKEVNDEGYTPLMEASRIWLLCSCIR